MHSAQHGLNRIELLILVVAIVTLAGAAIPAYRNYRNHTARPNFTEVLNAVVPYKRAIEACAKSGSCVAEGRLSGLGVGRLGLPSPSAPATYLASIVVAPNGTITAIATHTGGLVGETFVLTPTYVPGGTLNWASSGTCKTRAAGPIC